MCSSLNLELYKQFEKVDSFVLRKSRKYYKSFIYYYAGTKSYTHRAVGTDFTTVNQSSPCSGSIIRSMRGKSHGARILPDEKWRFLPANEKISKSISKRKIQCCNGILLCIVLIIMCTNIQSVN